MGGEGEGSGVKGGGKWGERGREVGVGYPPVHPLHYWFVLVSHSFFGSPREKSKAGHKGLV